MAAGGGDSAVARALWRAARYRLLAAAFAYPVPGRVRVLARHAREASPGPASERVSSALARLAEAAEAVDPAGLAAAYVGLFDGAVRCPPYEGAWGPQPISGKAAMLADVAGFYRAFGLAPAEQYAEIEDHVGAELEFMSVLALKEAHALAAEREDAAGVTRDAEATFLADHLGRWAEAFAARLAALAPPGFYPAAADLLAAWVAEDCAALAVEPAKVDTLTAAEATPMTCPMAPVQAAPAD